MGLEFRSSKSNFLSVSGILLLFCFQQFILYYSIYYLKRVNVVLYTLIIDVPLDMLLSFFGLYVTPIVFLLFNNASKCSLFQDNSIVSVDELLHSDLGLSTTIDLWDLILMFSHLLSNFYLSHMLCKSFWRLLTKMCSYVVVFSQIASYSRLQVFTKFLEYYKVEVKEGKNLIIKAKLFVVFIIFVLTTIFLLGLVIPTVDGDYKVEDKFKTNIFNEAVRLFIKFVKMFSRTSGLEYKKNSEALNDTTSLKSVDEGAGSLDMYTMAKFTFIIGFFLVDIPFLCYRLYILVKYNVFSLLLYKNFIFLFLRPYRLNMSQLAERDTAKGVQTAFLNTDLLSGNGVTFNLLDESEEDSEAQMLRRYSRKSSMRRRRTRALKSAFLPKLLTKLSFTQPRPHTKSDPIHLSSKLFNTPLHARFAGEAGGRAEANLGDGPTSRAGLFRRGSSYVSEGTMREGMARRASTESVECLEGASEHAKHHYRMYVLKILRRSKVLPIKSFPVSVILRHCRRFLFSKFRRFEHALFATVGDFTEPNLNRLVLAGAFLFSVAPRVALVFLYHSFELRSPREIVSSFSRGASFAEKFALEMCFGFSFVLFVLFMYCCRVYDSLFSFARDLLNLYSTMVCLHCFKSVLRDYDLTWLLFVFLLHPAYVTISFVVNVVFTKTASINNDTGFNGGTNTNSNTGTNTSSTNTNSNTGTNTSSTNTNSNTGININTSTNIDTINTNTNINTNSNASTVKISENSGVGASAGPSLNRRALRAKVLSLKAVYLLLKFSIAPVTLNHLLCSLDMVQTFKIHDSLLYSQWSHFFYSFFFRVLCCFNLDSKSSTLVLVVDLVLFFFYNAMSQSVRSLMFRKYEVNFIVMRLLGLLRFDWDHRDSPSEHCVTFADVDKYIRLQGLFSSPGIIIPPFV
ncbi:conserved hypothetical protein [Theileria orientalis strain Shintoku]|uniref:Uncharacterized protein n=1 Tax=Theileria orientalis strain Shintoku TaxID=869250 RepID=J4D9P7_THEOR|nr:conserved hypothetical protein [Theileria orientalis strain Shintoku]BAM41520.1 conserved hypothetical protein [Theileria orientalis strain Shintoku]|eukprot:XP_009691821.1 conserved hypothetical protein [Theileria orientalis strain Shintoku]